MNHPGQAEAGPHPELDLELWRPARPPGPGDAPELGGVRGLRWRRWAWRMAPWTRSRRWTIYRRLCGAARSFGASTCQHEAGWRTDHPGEGRCYLHGGLEPVTSSGPTVRGSSDLSQMQEVLRQMVSRFEASAFLGSPFNEFGRNMGRTAAVEAANAQLRQAGRAVASVTRCTVLAPEERGIRIGSTVTVTVGGQERRHIVTGIDGDEVTMEPTAGQIVRDLTDRHLGASIGALDLPGPGRLRDLLAQEDERAGQLWVRALQRTARGQDQGYLWRGWHPTTETLRQLHEAFVNLTHESHGQRRLARDLAADFLQRFASIGIRPRR